MPLAKGACVVKQKAGIDAGLFCVWLTLSQGLGPMVDKAGCPPTLLLGLFANGQG
jgi:hypothetical protein